MCCSKSVTCLEADVELAEEREVAEMDVQLLQTKAVLRSEAMRSQGAGLHDQGGAKLRSLREP